MIDFVSHSIFVSITIPFLCIDPIVEVVHE